MLAITPLDSWVRSHADAGGHSKWHLVLDVRQLQIDAYWNQVSRTDLAAERPFAMTPCGQAIGNPDFEQPSSLKPQRWSRTDKPIWIPSKGVVCTICSEVLVRQQHSSSVL